MESVTIELDMDELRKISVGLSVMTDIVSQEIQSGNKVPTFVLMDTVGTVKLNKKINGILMEWVAGVKPEKKEFELGDKLFG